MLYNFHIKYISENKEDSPAKKRSAKPKFYRSWGLKEK